MDKFEYKLLSYYNSTHPDIIDELNRLGDEGWELVHVQHYRASFYYKEIEFLGFFKRKIVGR